MVPLEGPEASLSPTWTALAFSLVLLSPFWPPLQSLSKPEAIGKVPSPALASTPRCVQPQASYQCFLHAPSGASPGAEF